MTQFAFELSFELKMPISAIAQMPLRDFFGYLTHSLRYMTPAKRQEIYLAQVSYLVAATMGGYKGSMSDFVLFQDAKSKKPRSKSAKKTKQTHKTKSTNGIDPFKNFSPVNKKG